MGVGIVRSRRESEHLRARSGAQALRIANRSQRRDMLAKSTTVPGGLGDAREDCMRHSDFRGSAHGTRCSQCLPGVGFGGVQAAARKLEPCALVEEICEVRFVIEIAQLDQARDDVRSSMGARLVQVCQEPQRFGYGRVRPSDAFGEPYDLVAAHDRFIVSPQFEFDLCQPKHALDLPPSVFATCCESDGAFHMSMRTIEVPLPAGDQPQPPFDFHDMQVVGKASSRGSQGAVQEPLDAGRAIDGEGFVGPVGKGAAGEKAGQTKDVVAVQVRDEDLFEPSEL